MGVEELDFGVEIGELGDVNGAIFKNPIMDESATLSGGGDNGKEGEIVDIETGEGHGVDFVDGGDESGFMDG